NVQGRQVAFRPDLGAGEYGGVPAHVKFPAVASENDLWSASTETSSSARSGARSTTTSRSARARSPSGATASGSPRATRSPTSGRDRSANSHPSHIALTHGSVPVRLDFTVLRIVRDPVVNHDIGIADAADRPVDIVEHRAIPARKPS